MIRLCVWAIALTLALPAAATMTARTSSIQPGGLDVAATAQVANFANLTSLGPIDDLSRPIPFAFTSDPVFTSVPAAEVVQGAPDISDGAAARTLTSSVIPEPATWALLIAGFVFIGAVRRQAFAVSA